MHSPHNVQCLQKAQTHMYIDKHTMISGLASIIYLANEPFEPTWCFLIWPLRRGYYSTDVLYTGKRTLLYMYVTHTWLDRLEGDLY